MKMHPLQPDRQRLLKGTGSGGTRPVLAPFETRSGPRGSGWGKGTGIGRVRHGASLLSPAPAIRGLFRAVCVLFFTANLAHAQDSPSAIVQKVGIDQNLGAQLPLDLKLLDETGRSVRLGDFFHPGRPVILTFVYYRCPMLCSKELESLTRSLRAMTMHIGSDFEIVTLSISPEETPALALAKKTTYMKALKRPGGQDGWHFLTGDAKSIAALTETAGFHYVFNPKTGLYAHDAGLIIVTPEGRIAKYLPGLDYPAKWLQAAVKESADGTIGRAATWIKLLCYDYDPATGKYSLAIMRTVQTGGILTVLALGASIFVMPSSRAFTLICSSKFIFYSRKDTKGHEKELKS